MNLVRLRRLDCFIIVAAKPKSALLFYYMILYAQIVYVDFGGEKCSLNEQINRTKAKSQQIVVQDYSHAYNTLFFI